jgi:hypothetical protein
MSRCTVCLDPRLADIDHLLAAGRSGRSLAAEFGIGPDAMRRHVRNHVVPTTTVDLAASGTDPLAELVDRLRPRALDGSNSGTTREYRLALAALAERSAERPAYDVVSDPEWTRLRTVLLEALADEPAVKLKLADAIRRAGAA